MNTQSSSRNPWLDVASYQMKDANRFKGREEDVAKFLKIIRSGTMSVLYSQSGIGKTSFLNAGIVPALQPEGYFPVHILFPDEVYEKDVEGLEQWLIDRMQELCGWVCTLKEEEERAVPECKKSLWWMLHAYRIKNEPTPQEETETASADHLDVQELKPLKPLIIFDQFEEVFTKSRKNAKTQLLERLFQQIEALSSRSLPPEVEQILEEKAAQGIFISVEVDPCYKVAFSLRKEYLSDFDYWTNDRYSVSELHQNRMLLLPLTRQQAEQVITCQPREDGEGYIDTLTPIKDDIINKMDERGHNEVDPFILSVLCSRLYDEAISTEHAQALGDIEPECVIWDFYCNKMKTIVSDEHDVAEIERVLVDQEDGSRHRPEAKTEQLRKIKFEERYCKALEDAHLVRTDTYDNKKYVELSHDLLAKAIKKHRYLTWQQELLKEQTIAFRKMVIKKIVYFTIGLFTAAIAIAYGILNNENSKLKREKRELQISVNSQKDKYEKTKMRVKKAEESEKRAKKEAEVAKKEAKVARKEAEVAKKEAKVARKEAEVAKKEAKVARKEAEKYVKQNKFLDSLENPARSDSLRQKNSESPNPQSGPDIIQSEDKKKILKEYQSKNNSQ